MFCLFLVVEKLTNCIICVCFAYVCLFHSCVITPFFLCLPAKMVQSTLRMCFSYVCLFQSQGTTLHTQCLHGLTMLAQVFYSPAAVAHLPEGMGCTQDLKANLLTLCHVHSM